MRKIEVPEGIAKLTSSMTSALTGNEYTLAFLTKQAFVLHVLEFARFCKEVRGRKGSVRSIAWDIIQTDPLVCAFLWSNALRDVASIIEDAEESTVH